MAFTVTYHYMYVLKKVLALALPVPGLAFERSQNVHALNPLLRSTVHTVKQVLIRV